MYKMFKNPLKYQQGGQLNQEQQQMLAAFIDWLPKRVKEFEGMQPEAIVQALDGMSKTPEGQRQVQAYVEQFQSEMNGIASHKPGGKIQDFICKHAKGGHVGCGCTQKGAEGMIVDDPEGYTWGQYNRNDFLNSGENHIGWTKVTTPDGRTGWARNYRRKFLGIPSRNLDQILVTPDLEDGKYRSVGRNLNGFFGKGQIDTTYVPRNSGDDTPAWRAVVDSSLNGVAPERKQQGGRVNSGYEGMEYVTTNENEPGLGTLYTGWTREYIPGTRDLARSDMYGGQPEGLKYTFRRLINNGTIRDQIVDRNPEYVSSIPNTTERLIQGTDTLYWPNRESFFKALTSKGTFAEGRPDWITLDQERNKYNASKKDDGGKVEKAQNGIPELNKIYSEKHTMVKGPSIGQTFLGIKRPWIAQTVSFNPYSAQNDTLYTGRNINAFDSNLTDDVLKVNFKNLPSKIKSKLAKIIDSDYSEYNLSKGSYPDNYYEKTIDVKKR